MGNWVINPGHYPAAHFATYPPTLVRPMIAASTSARGCCPACGTQWRRITERAFCPQQDTGDPRSRNKGLDASNRWAEYPRGTTATDTVGWQPTCTCNAGGPIPATVLDPFVGSGTTLRVATELHRASIGVDISADYLTNLVPARLAGTQISLPI